MGSTAVFFALFMGITYQHFYWAVYLAKCVSASDNTRKRWRRLREEPSYASIYFTLFINETVIT